jgi:hypothetical protein
MSQLRQPAANGSDQPRRDGRPTHSLCENSTGGLHLPYYPVAANIPEIERATLYGKIWILQIEPQGEAAENFLGADNHGMYDRWLHDFASDRKCAERPIPTLR